jgi:hypothetical protein
MIDAKVPMTLSNAMKNDKKKTIDAVLPNFG